VATYSSLKHATVCWVISKGRRYEKQGLADRDDVHGTRKPTRTIRNISRTRVRRNGSISRSGPVNTVKNLVLKYPK
jgi:hypothetical protein